MENNHIPSENQEKYSTPAERAEKLALHLAYYAAGIRKMDPSWRNVAKRFDEMAEEARAIAGEVR